MTNKIEVAVYMPDAEARQFLIFKQHYDIFEQMAQHGVLDIQYGKGILNFRAGILETVEKHEVVYRRKPELST